MKTSEGRSFSDRVVRRNRVLIGVLILMIVYMVVVGELGLGDSRITSPLAALTGRVIFFGGMVWVIVKICRNSELLKHRLWLREKMREENDEMNQMLYEKSGGMVWEVALVCQLFITLTTSLVNMAAFYSAFATLVVLILAKVGRLLHLKRSGV